MGIMGSPDAAPAQSIPAPGPCDSGTGSFVSCRIHVNVTTTIQPTRLLTVQPGTQFSLTPVGGGLTAANLTAGFYDSPGSLTLSVSANAPWRLSLRAASASMSGACAAKASSSITWGTSSGARTTPLTTTATDIVSGAAGTVNLTRSIFLRVGLSWLVDGPVTESNCGLPVAFTVSAP